MKYKIEFDLMDGRKWVHRQRTVEAVNIDAAQEQVKSLGRVIINYATNIPDRDPRKEPSRSMMREAFPADVWSRVEPLLENRRTANFRMMSPTDKLYLDEDGRYWIRKPNGDWSAELHMKGEWNMTGGGPKASHMVARHVPIEAGSWVIEYVYFMGKPILTISHWGIEALGA